MFGDLPLELLVLILKNLPTKSLLRFLCVSKSWYCLITSPSFLSLHHQHSLCTQRANGNDLLLIRHYSLSHKKERNTLFPECHNGHGEFFVEQCDLAFPLKTCDSYFYVGSCNGLICFSNLIVRNLKIAIWNPSMRKCLEVPVPRFVATDFMQINVIGFGLDCKTKTYRVLRLVYSIRNNRLREAPSQVEIYDVTTNVWRTIHMDVPYEVIEASGEVYMNGAVHWIGYKAVVDETPFRRLLVVLFDLQNEEFKEIPMPDDVALTPSFGLTLASFGETICLIHDQPDTERREESRNCCIWVMTEYGREDSWVKLFTDDMKGHGSLKRALGFRKNGQLLLVDSSDELVSYEIGSRQVTHLGLYGVERSFEIIPYLESLVLLKGKGELSSLSYCSDAYCEVMP